MNFIYLLAALYEYWDSLDFEKAYEVCVQLNKELKRDHRLHRTFILMDFLERLVRQEELLEALKEIPKMIQEKKNFEILQDGHYMVPLMFTMYSNAMLREKQEKYDMATLLMYRLLEMIEQKRLSKYNLYVSKMSYENILFLADNQKNLNELAGDQKREWLKSSVFEIKKQLFPKTDSRYLPEQISLLEGFIILTALEDAICKKGNGTQIEKLKRIRSMVFLRNNSIFAHGLGPVPRTDYLKFRTFVENLFRNFCQIEAIDFEEYLQQITWINPAKSRFYSRLEV